MLEWDILTITLKNLGMQNGGSGLRAYLYNMCVDKPSDGTQRKFPVHLTHQSSVCGIYNAFYQRFLNVSLHRHFMTS